MSATQQALALVETMRPRQWAKNGFVFAGILFDRQMLEPSSLLRVIAAFVLLSLAASTIYIVNDIVDIERDRQHPKKKNRPLPSGRLSVRVGWIAAAIFTLIALGGSFLLSWGLGLVILAYFGIHIAYSLYLKSVVILDIFAIAAGFVLRVVAGVVVISVQQFSPWLYVCVALLALFLAIGKRRQELVLLGDNAANVRESYKEYNLAALDDMLRLILAATAIAYTLYATEAETALARPPLLLLTVPFVYYALFRYLILIHVKGQGGDPTEVLYVDRPLQISIVLWVLAVFAALYLS